MSINWGPWAEVGMAAQLTATHGGKGIVPLTPEQGLGALQKILIIKQSQIAIAGINKTQLLNL